MLLRVIILFLFSASVMAGDFFTNWKPGLTEKLSYEIKTNRPVETTSFSYVEISREKNNEIIFTIKQIIDIPGQSVKIHTDEKYKGADLRLVSSHNYIDVPASNDEKLGTDSMVVKAQLLGDSLLITSTGIAAVSGNVYFPDNAITTIASGLKARDMDFKVGSFQDYQFINLYKLTGEPFVLTQVKDSIIGILVVSTPVGDFECFKVKNIVPETHGYTYYTTDSRHIMVKSESVYPKTDNPYVTITLTKYEQY